MSHPGWRAGQLSAILLLALSVILFIESSKTESFSPFGSFSPFQGASRTAGVGSGNDVPYPEVTGMMRPTDNCFYVTMQLGGDHSEHRADAAFRWMIDVSLASVDLAAAETESHVTVILSLTGTYESLAARLDPSKYPHVTLYHPDLSGVDMNGGWVPPPALDEITELVRDCGCQRATFVRIDADDMLKPNLLDQINHAVCKEDVAEPGRIINLGGHAIDKIILAPHEDGTVGCEMRQHPDRTLPNYKPDYKPSWFYSQALTVSLLVDDWLTYMPGTYFFGDHTKVKHTLEKSVQNQVKVEVVPIEWPAYYMITSLSSHYTYIHDLPTDKCDWSKLDTDPRIVKLLQDNIAAVPNLSAAEENENIQLQTTKRRDGRKKRKKKETKKNENYKA